MAEYIRGTRRMYDEEIIETNGMIIIDAIDYIRELFAGNSDGHGAVIVKIWMFLELVLMIVIIW